MQFRYHVQVLLRAEALLGLIERRLIDEHRDEEIRKTKLAELQRAYHEIMIEVRRGHFSIYACPGEVPLTFTLCYPPLECAFRCVDDKIIIFAFEERS